MAKGTSRLDKILEKNLRETKIRYIVNALEVDKSLVTIKPQDFIKRGSLPKDYSLVRLAENVQRNLGCYRCSIFFISNFADALVHS